MIEIILAIQLICGYQFTGMDKISCEHQIHSCYRKYKEHHMSDDFAMTKCAVRK